MATLPTHRALKPQTITFPRINYIDVGDADADPGATASSGLSCTYASDNPAIATIVANKIHPVARGSCSIIASQAGNGEYYPAPDVAQTLTVSAIEAQWLFYNGNSNDTAKSYHGLDSNVSYGALGVTLAYAKTSYIDFNPNINIGTRDFSYEMWIKGLSTQIIQNIISGFPGGNYTTIYMSYIGGNSRIYAQIEHTGSGKYIINVQPSDPSFRLNWSHIVYAVDRDVLGNTKIYVNSIEAPIISGPTNSDPTWSWQVDHKLSSPDSDYYWLDAIVGELRIWHSYLSIGEVLSQFNATKARYE